MITVIEPSWEWAELTEYTIHLMEKHLENCGRTCYKSEDRITDASSAKFVSKICRNRHESVLEHAGLTARIICSRSCSHQLVRHRIGAYSQESQRYVNYGKKGMKVICPPSIGIPVGSYEIINGNVWHNFDKVVHLNDRQLRWLITMEMCYHEYLSMLEAKYKPEDSRYVLPNATKTEVVATYNLRTWRHIIEERALNKHAQWEIRSVFLSIYNQLKYRLPNVFKDLEQS